MIEKPKDGFENPEMNKKIEYKETEEEAKKREEEREK